MTLRITHQQRKQKIPSKVFKLSFRWKTAGMTEKSYPHEQKDFSLRSK